MFQVMYPVAAGHRKREGLEGRPNRVVGTASRRVARIFDRRTLRDVCSYEIIDGLGLDAACTAGFIGRTAAPERVGLGGITGARARAGEENQRQPRRKRRGPRAG